MDEDTQFWLPPLALAGCLRGALLRDTTGRNLDTAERENYFPAAPLVTLSCWFEGHMDWVATPGFSVPHPGYSAQPCLLHGPFTEPSRTRNNGPVCVIYLLFYPDAFAALTGIDPGSLLNKVVDARDVLPEDWVRWGPTLAALPDNQARMDAVEAFLRPRWHGELAKRAPGRRFAEWAAALALRAATSSTGRSVRQVERRIKAWVGLPMGEIRAVSRAENVLLAAVATASPGSTAAAVKWAEVAVETDYADQSHLCREIRRITGFSPEQLLQLVISDPAFWCYRIWR
jgi:AraC-like DNA-binding protein